MSMAKDIMVHCSSLCLASKHGVLLSSSNIFEILLSHLSTWFFLMFHLYQLFLGSSSMLLRYITCFVHLPFWATAFLRRVCQTCPESDHPFPLLWISQQFFLQRTVVSLAANLQPGWPGLCIYVPQWQGSQVISPGTGFPFHHLLQLTGLRWRYSNLPPHQGFTEMITTNHLSRG
jgi:hypothetical protein